MIWGFIGPEGSGKTTGMSLFALMHIAMGGNVETFPGYYLKTPDGKHITHEVDFEKFFTNLYDYKNTIVCADEIQNFMDSHLSMSMFSRLIGYAAAQRRKANLGIFYTVQSWDWVYKRLRQLTHLVSLCYDMYWTPWGRDKGLQRGELLRLTTYDCKGFFTGQPWKMISQKLIQAIPLRPYYNSFATVDIFAGLQKFEVRRPTKIFDLRQPVEEDDSPFSAEPDMAKLEKRANDEKLLKQLSSNAGVSANVLSKLHRRLSSDG